MKKFRVTIKQEDGGTPATFSTEIIEAEDEYAAWWQLFLRRNQEGTVTSVKEIIEKDIN